MTLTGFLLARIAEDEEDARTAGIATGDRGFGDERLDSGSRWATRYHEVCRVRVHPDQAKRVIADAGAFVGMSIAPHIARHDPARVLAECEAKRRIVAEHAINPGWPEERRCPCGCDYVVSPAGPPSCDQCSTIPGDGSGCFTLRALALPYADHPDYREEWRP